MGRSHDLYTLVHIQPGNLAGSSRYLPMRRLTICGRHLASRYHHGWPSCRKALRITCGWRVDSRHRTSSLWGGWGLCEVIEECT